MPGLVKGKILFSDEELDKLSWVRRSTLGLVSGEHVKQSMFIPRSRSKAWIELVGYALLERVKSNTRSIFLNTWEVYTIRWTDWPYSDEFYHQIAEVRPNGWNVDVNGEGCTPAEAITIREMKYRILAASVGKTINRYKRFPIVTTGYTERTLPNACMDCKRPSCSERYS
jgi:hypothetical protein